MGLVRFLATAMGLCVGFICFAYSEAEALAYIEKYKATALRFEKEYGIPAPITLAQAMLESGAGTSSLTKASNNHFCIKAPASWAGGVYRCWDDETVKSRFRCYSSADESFRDYAHLLTNNARYRSLFSINIYDYRGWAHGLKKAGYATNPDYAKSLIGLIDHYKLYAVNGGVKLKPGKTQYVTRYKIVEKTVNTDSDKPVDTDDEFYDEEESIEISEDEVTEEELAVVESMKVYAVEINDIHCTVVQVGEDLRSVARKYNISQERLLKYNELANPNQVQPGDIIFLDHKKKRYYGPQDVYIVKGSNETLYDISQSFGIRLEYLAKMNDMSSYSILDKGMKICLK